MKGQERPTARIRRVDVSARSGASAAPADPEERLFRAYGRLQPGQVGLFRVGRVERCVCGGTIELTDNARIDQVVAAHNESALHQAWRAWRAEVVN